MPGSLQNNGRNLRGGRMNEMSVRRGSTVLWGKIAFQKGFSSVKEPVTFFFVWHLLFFYVLLCWLHSVFIVYFVSHHSWVFTGSYHEDDPSKALHDFPKVTGEHQDCPVLYWISVKFKDLGTATSKDKEKTSPTSLLPSRPQSPSFLGHWFVPN